MKNPWEQIALEDYENHMKQESVGQLPALNAIMKRQFSRCGAESILVLGVAGGNGLEHIDPKKMRKVYGVDINPAYLKECERRYPQLLEVWVPLCVDLTQEPLSLPKADLLVANLLVEYIGCGRFREIVEQARPDFVSCVIQADAGAEFVSASPYLHAFDGLGSVHRSVEERQLLCALEEAGCRLVTRGEFPLPNGKRFIQLDFQRGFVPQN